jgi:hypothetical protein
MGGFDTTWEYWHSGYMDASGIYHAPYYSDESYDISCTDSSVNLPVFEKCYNLRTINCKNHNLTANAPWSPNGTVNYI